MCPQDLLAFHLPCHRNPLLTRRSLPLNLPPLLPVAVRVHLHLLIPRILQRAALRRVPVLPRHLHRPMFAQHMDGKISAAMTRISEVFLVLVVPTTQPSFVQIFTT